MGTYINFLTVKFKMILGVYISHIILFWICCYCRLSWTSLFAAIFLSWSVCGISGRSTRRKRAAKNCKIPVYKKETPYPSLWIIQPPRTAEPLQPNLVTESTAFHTPRRFFGTKSIKSDFFNGRTQCCNVLKTYITILA